MSSADMRKHFSQNGKLHPKLRMFANGNPEVCVIRSELASAMALKEDKVTEFSDHLYRTTNSTARKAVTKPRSTEREKLDHVTENAIFNVFIELSSRDGAEEILKDNNITYKKLGEYYHCSTESW